MKKEKIYFCLFPPFQSLLCAEKGVLSHTKSQNSITPFYRALAVESFCPMLSRCFQEGGENFRKGAIDFRKEGKVDVFVEREELVLGARADDSFLGEKPTLGGLAHHMAICCHFWEDPTQQPTPSFFRSCDHFYGHSWPLWQKEGSIDSLVYLHPLLFGNSSAIAIIVPLSQSGNCSPPLCPSALATIRFWPSTTLIAAIVAFATIVTIVGHF